MNIEVKNLQFAYGTKQVLNISHTKFEQGKIYGIVGKNGVGKTTFFKTLTNIITNYTGEVLINGMSVKENPKTLAKVGIVLDDMELYKNQTGMFNIRYFGGLRGGFNEEQAMSFAHQLEIADSLDKTVSHYSLGMAKKLILLISVINDAETLIFDEPFRGLDSKSVNWFKNHLLSLRDKGRTILISSHIQDDIESLSDKVFVLHNGNFNHTFDLKNTTSHIYSVEVSDKIAFIALLQNKGIPFEEQGKFIKFEINDELYKELFRQTIAREIEFLQIKKENKYVELIK
ncbi:MAG: ATP-binding cassette domain-containing protein [Prevotellaceae bacterium]|jgi:ABC-2 type transport system ATP-binding protein|nr:ATP-binding cassette domain-containing protein [Prevotellaceae bacterium]